LSDPKPWWEGDYVFRPAETADPVEPVPSSAPLPEPPLLEALPVLAPCWRCGKEVQAGTAACPYCRARLRSDAPLPERAPRKVVRATSPLLPVLGFYGGLLFVSLVQGVLFFNGVRNGDLTPDDALHFTLVAAGIDTVLVFASLFCIRRPAPLPRVSSGTRAGAWAVAVPLLAALLGLNIAYHLLLRNLLGLPTVDLWAAQDPFALSLLLLICVQPAIVEELFFRYLALGALRRHMSLHGAVLVSSVMFGMAHVGQPLSIPYLMLVGMVLGYVRATSRSLVLPMLMHFAHNLAVLLLASAA
jgi:CAAX protease family protein